MHVPLLDLKRHLTAEAPELRAAFERVLQSGHYINGPEVEHFEADIARFCEVPHAIGVSSGTDALLLTMMALNIGSGDEVVCPSYSFFATAGSIWRTGAKPVFVDSCLGCFNVLPHAVAAALTQRTRAVMPVHLFGQCTQMASLRDALGSSPIAIIEDAAQAVGARARTATAEQHTLLDHPEDAAQITTTGAAGGLGTAGCFSFFPSKNLGALGDAGLVTTHDASLAHKLRMLRNHGAQPKYYHAMVGGNFRLDAMQAAFLRVKLPALQAATRARQANAEHYDKIFCESGLGVRGACICTSESPSTTAPSQARITLPATPGPNHVYNQYVVMFDTHARREQVRQHLLERQIGCEIYYPVPLHRQACFADLATSETQLPNAERAAQCSLALPIFAGLTGDEIDHVAVEVLLASAKRLAA